MQHLQISLNSTCVDLNRFDPGHFLVNERDEVVRQKDVAIPN